MWPTDAGAEVDGALSGVRVVDISRILAGPTCTQILGDLGADVLKVEQPGRGDDTRRWGPPYVTGPNGSETSEAAYYLAVNRNKRSVAIDLSTEAGLEKLNELLASADVLVENFKAGSLERYGLGYEEVQVRFPRLVYCSITGFGRTGPYRERPGYDFVAQSMGGIMSITGEPDGSPMKVGVGIADVASGLYAAIGILAALRHRDQTGEGQQVDIALLDTQVSLLVNEATNYFVAGEVPRRRGNEHPNIVPYGVYGTSDGYIVVAVGNDAQFERWCEVAGASELAEDERFVTNAARVDNREALDELVVPLMRTRSSADWLTRLEAAGVPCGPVSSLDEVFSDPQVLAREMRIEMDYPHSREGSISLVGSPLKLSATPVTYRTPPPLLGEQSAHLEDMDETTPASDSDRGESRHEH